MRLRLHSDRLRTLLPAIAVRTSYVLMGLWVFASFLHTGHFGSPYPMNDAVAMVQGRADRPFVMRCLVPWMVQTVQMLTPISVIEVVNLHLQPMRSHWLYLMIADPNPNAFWPRGNLYGYAVMVTLMLEALFLAGYVTAMAALGRRLLGNSLAVECITVTLALLTFAWNLWPAPQIYDLPTLFLSTTLLLLLLKRDLGFYLIIFAFAAINRETSIIFAVYSLLVLHGRMPRGRLFDFVAAQFAIWLVVRLFILWMYKSNPGYLAAFHHMPMMIDWLLGGFKRVEFLWVMALAFAFGYRWHEKPAILRQGLVLLPLLYVAYLAAGFPGELRVFMEFHPIAVLLLAHSFISICGLRLAARAAD